MFTKPFKKLGKSDAGIAGGKGASLGEMTQSGIPVPPGFVVLAIAFERFLEETDLNSEIDAILHTVNHMEIHTVEHASEKIQALILKAEMPKDIGTEINSQFKILNSKYVAVRSSATAEDSASAAWAGQLDTFLNTTEKDLLKNVQRCWASLFTPRAIFYRFEKELHKSKISVAVVVQKMVQSEVSGIAFSVHPVTEDYNQLIIEAGLGLGEAIVSGQITPDSYVVHKTKRFIFDKNISVQERALVRKGTSYFLIRPPAFRLPVPVCRVGTGRPTRQTGGRAGANRSIAKGKNGVVASRGGGEGGGEETGNEWVDVPRELGEKQTLTDAQILELSEIVIGIEEHYGFPCDIEWAFERGKFYITQSRPITTLKTFPKTKPELWVNNASIEVTTYQVMSPVMDFGISYGVKEFCGDPHAYLLRRFFYFQGSKLEGMYYPDTDLDMFARDILEYIYAYPERVERNHRESYRLNTTLFRFSERLIQKDFRQYTNEALAKLYRMFTFAQEKAHAHSLATTWFVDSTEGLFANRLLEETKRLVTGCSSTLNPAEVFTTLTTSHKLSLARQEELESLQLLRRIVRNKKTSQIFSTLRVYDAIPSGISAGLLRALRAHCEKWRWIPYGYTGPAYNLDYYFTVWAGLVREGLSPREEIKKLKARPKEVAQARNALFVSLRIPATQKRIYDIAADVTFLKGYRKDCSYKAFYAYSFLAEEIARRLQVTKETVYFLTYHEILRGLKGEIFPDFEEIEKRRKGSAVMLVQDGETRVVSGHQAEQFVKEKTFKKIEEPIGSNVFKGNCASAGRARGTVRIVNQPEEMHKMEQGDIMVSHTTFPSLVPAMKKASAIVTEDGGITCHAAIVSRELGKPCVTGIKGATRALRDGDTVEVDADNGMIRLIKRK